ncbi:MAG: beta-N-acetylhexosaminidase [Desulfobulbaceae bacterium]|nr:beta-N-acetylhexosaminidase [Desulfobulbaceae bacterium]
MDIGQMFMLGFNGTEVDDGHWIVRALEKDHLGGVILFDRNIAGSVQNITSSSQLQDLSAALQEYAAGTLLVGVDQEGGRVCRLKERDGFPKTLSAKVIAQGDLDQAAHSAGMLATTLARHGINFNLAPVVDLDLNPDNPIIGRFERSFGDDPDQVVCNARVFIDAHHRQGVACCLKHFPGHGSAAADSHLGFVDSTEYWHRQELIPFARLIAEGFSDAVMTAHVINRRLDPQGLPATLSPAVIKGCLRGKLEFSGVTVTDDLQMQAITKKWGYAEAVRLAVLAGVDLLIVGNNLDQREDTLGIGLQTIKDMLDRGEVDADYIAGCLQRIATLKKKIAGELAWKNNIPTILS